MVALQSYFGQRLLFVFALIFCFCQFYFIKMSCSIVILAIESSCDDTAAAVLIDGKIVSNVVAGQCVHEKFGGVVPELASRAHQQNIVPTIEAAIRESGIRKADISAVAFTQGPGLIGSLVVGASFAKGMAIALDVPLIAVQHLQAHVLAHCIDEPKPEFPFLCLTVSGGHTQIVLVHSPYKMEIVGQTIDDAAGEAFDKSAKLFGLPYPGGPLVDKYARVGNPKAFVFPQPKTKNEFDFSFSGLKTSVLYLLQKETANDPDFVQNNLSDLCASLQDTIVRYLLKKLQAAAKFYGINQVAIAGGVSANSGLRAGIVSLGQRRKWDVFVPQFQYCTDNAGMIAISAYYKFLAGDFVGLEVVPLARMNF